MLRRALDSVFRQDRADFEVVVVDDGTEASFEATGRDPVEVRVVRTHGRGVGAARLAGLEAARGRLVAYCDDDDEWAPSHLSLLAGFLLERPDVALAYGDSEWVESDAEGAVAYSLDYYRPLLQGSNYIFASDVVHRAAPARDVGGFDPSLQAYEDWDLWLRMSQFHPFRHVRAVVGRHHWHPGCVSAEDHWEDRERVREANAGRVAPFDRRTWRDGRRQLIWSSIMRRDHSFGRVARQLLPALERHGVDARIFHLEYQPPEGLERFYRAPERWGSFAFYYDWRQELGALGCERIVNYLTWETTLAPPEQVKGTNDFATLLYVPCRQNAEAFREGGVRVPIKVLHHGVNPDQFPLLERPPRDCFTFGTFGDLSPRKGTDVLVRAFQEEFRESEDVRLVMKALTTAAGYAFEDPRITVVTGYMEQPDILALLRDIDAFVLPSRGEGFGLPGLEAMATGLPVIATNWSGPTEYLSEEDSLPLSYHLVDAKGTFANNIHYRGEWAEPSEEHLRELLRWLYEHPRQAAEMGARAAARVRRDWSWDTPARQIRDDLDELAGR